MKVTLADGMIFEGTFDEYVALCKYNNVEPKQSDPERLKVGDYAKVVDDEETEFEVGTIVKITQVDNDEIPYYGYALDGEDYDVFYEKNLVRATPEEVSEAKAKLKKAEEEERWAKIGRKVSEFKVGDVVRVIDHGVAGLSLGTISTVKKTSEDGAYIDEINKYGSDAWYSYRKLEIIAPVESVVNLSVKE